MLEQGNELDKQPRAAHFATSATYEMERAGVLDDVRAQGFPFRNVCWRKIDGSFIAGARPSEAALPSDYPYRMVVLPLDRLLPLLYAHLQRQSTAAVRLSHAVVSVGQHEGTAWVDVVVQDDGSERKQRIEADYVIGCDGASSAVRRALFGPDYPGETLDAQIIATNVRERTTARAHLVGCDGTADDVKLTGTLRLQQIRILGFEFHRTPDQLVHGGQDRSGQFASRDLW